MAPITVRSAIAGTSAVVREVSKKLVPTANIAKKQQRLAAKFRRQRYLKNPNIYTKRVSGLNKKPPGRVVAKKVTRPQIVLCNWLVTLLRPGNRLPDNVVMFKVDGKMTKFDIKNYLQEIYKIPVEKVNTSWQLGKSTRHPQKRGVMQKKPDFKRAYVIMGEGYKFRYPDDPLEFPPDDEDIVVPADHWDHDSVE